MADTNYSFLAKILYLSTINKNIVRQIFQSVLQLLSNIGYTPKDGDDIDLAFFGEKVAMQIKNFCHINDVPEGLMYACIDRIVGEFLFTRLRAGKLDIDTLDLSSITSIKEGDTQVNFGESTSDSAKLDAYLNSLIRSGEGDLLCYRKLRW